jgi:glycine/D-amino acid oxidase-like deaminating enzyme
MRKRVAILGAGIMGASLALLLARRGLDVWVFDKEDEPVACASRWNEGKIHLGYMYAADPTMGTAKAVLPGGLLFGRLIEDLVGRELRPHITPQDDIYLIHRHSVVDAPTVRHRFDEIDRIIRGSSDARQYLADLSDARARQLSGDELAAIANQREIVAAFEVPERSVDTQWVADRLTDALRAEPAVTLQTGTRITSVAPVASHEGKWRVVGDQHLDGPFDIVVNALWEGRLQIDLTAGIRSDDEWSHRYRLCLFVRTRHEVDVRSALVSVGPFGDMKNYNGRDFYLSWYPTGLIAEGSDITLAKPRELTPDGEQQFIRQVRSGLGALMPGAAVVLDAADEIKIRGGYVFAQGKGSLADASSSIHRRDRFGVRRAGNYFSVDTGKYSTAPWLAARLAQEICGEEAAGS